LKKKREAERGKRGRFPFPEGAKRHRRRERRGRRKGYLQRKRGEKEGKGEDLLSNGGFPIKQRGEKEKSGKGRGGGGEERLTRRLYRPSSLYARVQRDR